MAETLSLNGTWRFKEFIGMDWVWRDSVMPKTNDVRWWMDAAVPGSVASDVLNAGLIADPYFELNSKQAEWISARTWVYRRRFSVTQEQLCKRAFLHLDGIDYESQIFLNGEKIANQCGMFIPVVVEITGRLQEGENLLAIVLEPAPAEQPQVGKTSLTRAHKCRMTYWWDFCPRLIHQGIWKPVSIVFTGPAVLEDVHVSGSVSPDCVSAQARVAVEVRNAPGYQLAVSFNGEEKRLPAREGLNEITFDIAQVQLWQPNGLGDPHEYPVRVRLEKDGETSDDREMRYGFKRVEWLKNPTREQNDPFLLQVNGRRVFIRGYNWVPQDVMYGAAGEERLRELFHLLRDAGVNLLRIWGGGLIETEAFYRLCAQNGIMVWQEFLFSSSAIDNRPPEDPAFIEMMQEQAEVVIRSRRSETALLAWCGGNELQSDDGAPLTIAHPFLKMLDDAVRRHDPGRRFLATSPSGGVFMNSLANIAKAPEMLCDVHGPWEHQGITAHQALYNAGSCQLHSEFGVEGMANAYALNRTISPQHQVPAGKDNPVYFHRGAWWINDALLEDMFGPLLQDASRMRRASQYSQYEGLKYALERDRSRYPVCGGVLPWQFNEPYPNAFCTSNVDYYLQPKPAYYGVKRAYQPQLPVARFDSASLYGQNQLTVDLSVLSDEAFAQPAQLHAALYALDGRVCKAQTYDISSSQDRVSFSCALRGDEGFLILRLTWQPDGACPVCNEYLFTTGKTLESVLEAGKPQVEGSRCGQQLTLSNTGTEAALFITAFEKIPGENGRHQRFSDGGLCLLPGEQRVLHMSDTAEQTLAVEGLNLPMQTLGSSKDKRSEQA